MITYPLKKNKNYDCRKWRKGHHVKQNNKGSERWMSCFLTYMETTLKNLRFEGIEGTIKTRKMPVEPVQKMTMGMNKIKFHSMVIWKCHNESFYYIEQWICIKKGKIT